MRPGDLADVMRIERTSFTMPWRESTFRGLMRRPSAALSVAEVEEVLAGFSVVWFAADEAELGDLAVEPAFRRRGVARALLARVLAECAARGARTLYLEVRESNAAARALYERAGFEMVGRRREYYTAPREDACVMRLLLQDSAR
jgi:[ribosomal protein S18]-alanine N-acetyltransferase